MKLAWFACLAFPLGAQVAASISGAVTDQSGARVGDAKVTITNSSTGAARATSCDSTGRYEAAALPAGTLPTCARATRGFPISAATTVPVPVSASVAVPVSAGPPAARIC